jgi:DNA-binding MarR family transcriptional regulator
MGLARPAREDYVNCMGDHVTIAPQGRGRSAPSGGKGTRAVLDELRLLVRALRVSARGAEKRVGISGAQLFVLQTLDELGTASIGELARQTHTDPSSVSVVVSRLVARRLVNRGESRQDARRAEVRLTAKGRGVLRGSPESTQTRLIAALERMPSETRKRLARGLGQLVRQMGLSGEPRMFFEDEAGESPKKGGGHARA